MRGSLLAAILVVVALGAAIAPSLRAGGSDEETSGWVESLLYNPRERTLAGLDALERGDFPAAVEAFEVAARLSDDPATRFNLGTARLFAGRGDAVGALTAVARSDSELAPRAFYNLGTSLLDAGELGAAIEALEESLRRAPDFRDAKVNLEIALRRVEPPEPEEGEDGDEQEDGDQGEQDGAPPPPSDDGEAEPDQSGDGEQSPSEQQREKESPLPQFRDLEDMTAEEAAAILEAVENLEREERRDQMLEAMKNRPQGSKDW